MHKASKHPAGIDLSEQFFRPGLRVAVAVSGGADSVALLRAMLDRSSSLGLVLSVVHVHHGIRGAEADGDQAFVEELASRHSLPVHLQRVETPAYAAEQRETLEEAARNLRYAIFRELLAAGRVDAVATAHTLDDQAETVLYKLLRGAWTEGLGGISPSVTSGAAAATTMGAIASPETAAAAGGSILRPLLSVSRVEIEAYLRRLNQPWREDATNRDMVHTRNRLRHHLLPILKEYNPQIAAQFSRLAAIARDEDAWWQKEVSRVGKMLLLPGKPVRGGGRASSTHPDEASIAFELERLRALEPAMRRRLLRWAVLQVQTGVAEAVGVDFEQTGLLLEMCSRFSNLKRLELSSTLTVQRTARELQFFRAAGVASSGGQAPPGQAPIELPVPGTAEHAASGTVFTAMLRPDAADSIAPAAIAPAVVRAVQAGDRVTLRYSRGPKKAKEIFERLRVPAAERAARLVVAWEGHIVWMEGVEVEPESVAALPLMLEVVRRSAVDDQA